MRLRRARGALVLALALLLVASFATAATAQTYRFTTVADSAEGFDPFEFGCPAINNLGQVAFRASTDEGVQAIYRAGFFGRTTIVEDTAGFDFIGRNPSINDLGAVSFAATISDDGEGIFRGRGGPLTTIARTDPGIFNFFGFDTSINNRGQVAFSAELDNFDEGLFSGSGGAIRTYYLASTSQFSGADSGASLNDLGQVAFFEFLDDDGTGVFRSSGQNFVTIAGEELSPDNPSLNIRGRVAFTASFIDGDDFVEAIMTGTGGPVTTVADTRGPFAFFNEPSLNNVGRVAFSAFLDDGGQGIFTGPNVVADRVIGTGDQLAGSVVTSVSMCREGLNDVGMLAFQAQLEDGRTVIVRATPS